MTRPDFQDTDGEQGFVIPATVTLSNGDRVPSNSLMWLDECRKRHNHVQTLLSMTGHGSLAARREYIGNVGRADGQEAARRLTAAFAEAFAKRQAEEAAEAVGREAA